MAMISRAWFSGLQRMFPSAIGNSRPWPVELTDTVSFVKDMQAFDFVNNIRLRRQVVTGVGAGATIELFLQGPDQGFVQVPVSMILWSDNTTAAQWTLAYLPDGNPEDPWGAWDTLARTFITGSVPASFALGEFATASPAQLLPLTRGWRWRINFLSAAAGRNFRVHFYYFDIPGDVLAWDKTCAWNNGRG